MRRSPSGAMTQPTVDAGPQPASQLVELLPQAVSTELVRRINSFLHARSVPEVDHVQVEDEGSGVILLRGQISSLRSKSLCLSCCQRVAGVIHVIDKLKVCSQCVD